MPRYKAAIFDLDGTLVSSDLSALTYTNFGGERYERALYKLRKGLVSFHQFLVESVDSLKGVSAYELQDFVARRFKEHLRRGARECIEELKSEMEVGIVTRNFWTFAKPIAEELGIEHIECSYFDIKNGRLTGKVKYENKKEEGIKRISRKIGVDLKEVIHVDDEDYYEFVGLCFILNPFKGKRGKNCCLIKDLF